MRVSVVTPTIRPEGLLDVQQSLERQTLTDFEWLVEVGVTSHGNDLNRAYNRMLRRATGSLVVSIQDYTMFGDSLLEELYRSHEENPSIWYTVDVAHTDGIVTEYDWRHYRKGEDINFMEYELCVGSFPLVGMRQIGGFDEELDELTWGFDNVNVGFRAKRAGFPLKVHPTAEAVQYKHDLTTEHPFRAKMIPDLHNARLGQIERGEVKIRYI